MAQIPKYPESTRCSDFLHKEHKEVLLLGINKYDEVFSSVGIIGSDSRNSPGGTMINSLHKTSK